MTFDFPFLIIRSY